MIKLICKYCKEGNVVIAFNNEQIDEVLGLIRTRGIAVNNLTLTYQNKRNNLLVHTYGEKGFAHDEEYIMNMKENLEYIQLSALNTLIQHFGTDIQIDIDALPDGSLSKNLLIELIFSFNVNIRRNTWSSSLIKHLDKLIPFAHHTEFIRLNIANGNVTNVFFDLKVESKDINRLIRQKANQAIVSQWVNALYEVAHIIKYHDYMQMKVPISNGRIRVEHGHERVSLKFNTDNYSKDKDR